MRTVKTTIISILAVGLLAGSAVGVAAQDEEAAADMPTGSAYFTGTYEGETIETSDSRLSGSLTSATDWAFLDPNMSLLAETHAWLVENDAGSWTGEGTAIVHSAAGTPPSSFLTIELTGAGGYEGLTAVVLADRTENPPVIEGAIIDGELPPVPELPAQ